MFNISYSELILFSIMSFWQELLCFFLLAASCCRITRFFSNLFNSLDYVAIFCYRVQCFSVFHRKWSGIQTIARWKMDFVLIIVNAQVDVAQRFIIIRTRG